MRDSIEPDGGPPNYLELEPPPPIDKDEVAPEQNDRKKRMLFTHLEITRQVIIKIEKLLFENIQAYRIELTKYPMTYIRRFPYRSPHPKILDIFKGRICRNSRSERRLRRAFLFPLTIS